MSRAVQFSPNAWAEYAYWQSRDAKITKRINKLIKDVQRNPFEGIGKPEQLRGDLSGFWSRRIDIQHRLVYAVEDDAIIVLQCRKHY